MKALVVHTLSDDLSGVSLVDRPDPVCATEQVLVRVRAAALNFPDLLMTQGRYQFRPELPFAPGMEVAGEVVEAPAGGRFAPGDRVRAGMRCGGLAELVACDPDGLVPIPAGIDDATAAAFGMTYLTAYVALVRLARLAADEWVLVHGASGGVGWAAVDVAQALGARVIATSRSADKRRRLHDALAPTAVLPAPGFRDEVRRLTGGGAAVVLDPVGGEVFGESTRCIGFGGRLLVTGFTGGIATLPTNIALIKAFAVIGVRAGEYGRRFPAQGREDRDVLWTMLAAGRLHPHVGTVLPLADWREGFGSLAVSRHLGRIVLVP